MVPSWIWNLPMNLIAKEANKAGLDRNLVCAMIMVESSGHEFSSCYERHWHYWCNIPSFAKLCGISEATEKVHQATSWGPMQIMGGVAREIGYARALPLLGSASMGMHWGCKKLKLVINKHGYVDDAISSYNQGSPRKFPNGKYENQAYVDKVNKFWNEIK